MKIGKILSCGSFFASIGKYCLGDDIFAYEKYCLADIFFNRKNIVGVALHKVKTDLIFHLWDISLHCSIQQRNSEIESLSRLFQSLTHLESG